VNTAFVTGGSGFLGINLVRYLLGADWKVVTFDREPFDYPERAQTESIVGDIRDFEALREATEGASIVIHCAAALPLNSADEIFSVDVDGTRNVFEAASATGVSRVVHISSTAVYGVPDSVDLREDHELIGVGPYGKAKIAAESIAASYRNQMAVSILRPKSFIGPERLGVFSLLFDWAATGHHFPIPGSGHNKYQYLDVEDLCAAIFLCMTVPEKIASDTFNIGARQFGTFRQDFQAVLDEAGFGKKVKGLPVLPVIWALRLLDRLGLSPLYPWVYETAVKDSYVSIEKARDRLGWEPRFSNQDALLKNFRWYVTKKHTFAAQSGTTHRVPWKQGALGLAKVFFR
jgi:nucleoside-diphosphate-sugar epimerase